MRGHVIVESDYIEFVVCYHGDAQVCIGAVDIEQ